LQLQSRNCKKNANKLESEKALGNQALSPKRLEHRVADDPGRIDFDLQIPE
jgi:hypothetical protein